MKSYQNYKVFRVQIPDQKSLEQITSLRDVHVWKNFYGGSADLMIGPKSFSNFQILNLNYSIIIENVQDLIEREKVRTLPMKSETTNDQMLSKVGLKAI